MKFCKDCKHFNDGACHHPKNVKISPVLGIERPAQSAEYLRQLHYYAEYKACEPEGFWFEERVAKVECENTYADEMISREKVTPKWLSDAQTGARDEGVTTK